MRTIWRWYPKYCFTAPIIGQNDIFECPESMHGRRAADLQSSDWLANIGRSCNKHRPVMVSLENGRVSAHVALLAQE